MGISVQPCCCGSCPKCAEGFADVVITFLRVIDEDCANCNEYYAASTFTIPIFFDGTKCSGSITVPNGDCPDGGTGLHVGVDFKDTEIVVTLNDGGDDVGPPASNNPSTIIYKRTNLTVPYNCDNRDIPLFCGRTTGVCGGQGGPTLYSCDYGDETEAGIDCSTGGLGTNASYAHIKIL